MWASTGVVLQHLAADIQRQVLGVHHAVDEAQPGRQQPVASSVMNMRRTCSLTRLSRSPSNSSNGFMPGTNSSAE